MEITSLFCDMDDFYKIFEIQYNQQQITEGKKQRHRSCNLSLSEIMLILVLFHNNSGYRNFKGYYEKYILGTCKNTFPDVVSYSRFIDLIPRAFLPLCGYLNTRQGKKTGIAFVDSPPWWFVTIAVSIPTRYLKDLPNVEKTRWAGSLV